MLTRPKSSILIQTYNTGETSEIYGMHIAKEWRQIKYS